MNIHCERFLENIPSASDLFWCAPHRSISRISAAHNLAGLVEEFCEWRRSWGKALNRWITRIRHDNPQQTQAEGRAETSSDSPPQPKPSRGKTSHDSFCRFKSFVPSGKWRFTTSLWLAFERAIVGHALSFVFLVSRPNANGCCVDLIVCFDAFLEWTRVIASEWRVPWGFPAVCCCISATVPNVSLTIQHSASLRLLHFDWPKSP